MQKKDSHHPRSSSKHSRNEKRSLTRSPGRRHPLKQSKKLTPSQPLPLRLRQALYRKYSGSQNHYYLSLIDSLIFPQHSKSPLKIRYEYTTSQSTPYPSPLIKLYQPVNPKGKGLQNMKCTLDLYQYHRDIPRFFILPDIQKALLRCHHKKRLVQYFRLARELGVTLDHINTSDRPVVCSHSQVLKSMSLILANLSSARKNQIINLSPEENAVQTNRERNPAWFETGRKKNEEQSLVKLLEEISSLDFIVGVFPEEAEKFKTCLKDNLITSLHPSQQSPSKTESLKRYNEESEVGLRNNIHRELFEVLTDNPEELQKYTLLDYENYNQTNQGNRMSKKWAKENEIGSVTDRDRKLERRLLVVPTGFKGDPERFNYVQKASKQGPQKSGSSRHPTSSKYQTSTMAKTSKPARRLGG